MVYLCKGNKYHRTASKKILKMQIAIFGNPSASKVSGQEPGLFNRLHGLGHEILIDSDYLDFLRDTMKWQVTFDRIIRTDDLQADIVISIGGDGTFLRTAAKVGRKGIPMIGINTGRLGFLADVTLDSMDQAIDMLHNGRYTIQERHLLELDMKGMPAGHTPYALNDIAILKHDISSMISISTSIGDNQLITYQADGLVIATSTGSTAYSLSVGGPIVAPGTNVTVLTPVAPHSLTMRPLVLPANQTIRFDVGSRSHSFLLSIDGNSFSCHEHTPIEIRRAPFTLRVIRLEGSSFYATLQQKMFWGSDSRR